VGIEFVDPPPLLRQLIARRQGALTASRKTMIHRRALATRIVRGRQFIPHLERDPGNTSPWHLIVSVDGVPCFSHRYTSEAAALVGWSQFKRAQAKQ
jgi:hypothetical protein